MELDEREIERDFDIDTSSAFALENELKNYSKTMNKYLRLAKQANEEFNSADLELEMIIAKIIEKIRVAEKIPPSAVDKLKKTRVPLDSRYQLKKGEYNQKLVNREYVNGLVKAFEARGYRLGELVDLAHNIMWPEPKIKGSPTTTRGVENQLDKAGANLELE